MRPSSFPRRLQAVLLPVGGERNLRRGVCAVAWSLQSRTTGDGLVIPWGPSVFPTKAAEGGNGREPGKANEIADWVEGTTHRMGEEREGIRGFCVPQWMRAFCWFLKTDGFFFFLTSHRPILFRW